MPGSLHRSPLSSAPSSVAVRHHPSLARRVLDEEGQATTEYALVLLAAALVALTAVAWATTGGGAGRIGHLFDRIIDVVIGKL